MVHATLFVSIYEEAALGVVTTGEEWGDNVASERCSVVLLRYMYASGSFGSRQWSVGWLVGWLVEV
jgi:hypothetical protein